MLLGFVCPILGCAVTSGCYHLSMLLFSVWEIGTYNPAHYCIGFNLIVVLYSHSLDLFTPTHHCN